MYQKIQKEIRVLQDDKVSFTQKITVLEEKLTQAEQRIQESEKKLEESQKALVQQKVILKSVCHDANQCISDLAITIMEFNQLTEFNLGFPELKNQVSMFKEFNDIIATPAYLKAMNEYCPKEVLSHEKYLEDVDLASKGEALVTAVTFKHKFENNKATLYFNSNFDFLCGFIEDKTQEQPDVTALQSVI